MIKLTQELFFIHDGLHAPLGNNPSFEHFFERIFNVGLLVFNFPYFSKSTSSNYIFKSEIVLADFLYLILLCFGFEMAIAHF